MGKDRENPARTNPELEQEIAIAYVLGAVNHAVIVEYEDLIRKAKEQVGVTELSTRNAVIDLAANEKVVFLNDEGKLGKDGIPKRAERSTDDVNKQEETASNLYYALVENGDTVDAHEAIGHAIFTAGVTERAAKGAVWRMANDQDIDLSWDGKISQYTPKNRSY